MDELVKIVAALFLIREKQMSDAGQFWAANAYANAFDLMLYAITDCKDCIRQFDGYDKAEAFVKAHPNANFWELEDIFKGW